MKKTVLITGGSGFIGSHLCDKFISEGFKVICVDNLVTGRIGNIKHLKVNNNFRFLKQDVSVGIDVKEKVHYVLHFASPASPVDYLNHPLETLKVGSLGTLNALELTKRNKAIFLMASTSEIYGDPLEHPQVETYWGNVNSIGVRSCYDEAKRFSEALVMAYRRLHKLDTKIVRIFNTYGPRMSINDGRVVPNFIYQALNNKPITVYGDGSQTRSFCYVSDLVEGIFRLANSKINDPVNLGNPSEFKILEFASLVLKFTVSKSKIVFKKLPSDDPKQRCPDITRAKNNLHWLPLVNLEKGLQETIDWFKSHHS